MNAKSIGNFHSRQNFLGTHIRRWEYGIQFPQSSLNVRFAACHEQMFKSAKWTANGKQYMGNIIHPKQNRNCNSFIIKYILYVCMWSGLGLFYVYILWQSEICHFITLGNSLCATCIFACNRNWAYLFSTSVYHDSFG